MSERRTKYGNVRGTWRGMRFDARAEVDDAIALGAMVDAGEIRGWIRGGRWCVVGCQSDRRTDRVEYVPDFEVWLNDGRTVLLERKGMPTPAWRIKEKLMHEKYPETPLLVLRRGDSARRALLALMTKEAA